MDYRTITRLVSSLLTYRNPTWDSSKVKWRNPRCGTWYSFIVSFDVNLRSLYIWSFLKDRTEAYCWIANTRESFKYSVLCKQPSNLEFWDREDVSVRHLLQDIYSNRLISCWYVSIFKCRQSYELCSDMIDAVLDMTSIYTPKEGEERELNSSSVINLDNGMILYLRSVNRYANS